MWLWLCLYLDREGLIYRVHECCRGLHAVSAVAELCLIVLHSVFILHPHVSASGQRRRIPMQEVTVSWWASSVSKIIPQRHNLLCFLSAQIWQLFSFFLILQLLWSKLKCTFQCDNNETLSCTMWVHISSVTIWSFDFDAYLHPHTACWEQTVLCIFKSNGNMNNLAVTLRFQVYMVELW